MKHYLLLCLYMFTSKALATVCWTCDAANGNEDCLSNGRNETCADNEVCQNEVRVHRCKTLVTKRCKQREACHSNQAQNVNEGSIQCNNNDANSICRSCCDSDLCNTDLLTLSGNSCAGRCTASFDSNQTCQCNFACTRFGDCCDDHEKLCMSVVNGVRDSEIRSFSLDLYDLDDNRINSNEFMINLQNQTDDKSRVDSSQERFFTFLNERVMNKPIYRAFINLLDNYEKTQGINETISNEEMRENERFLNYFIDSRLGVRLYEFLAKAGLAGCEGKTLFKEFIRIMWFEVFTRRNNALDTSGFEHVFVGELRSSGVSVTGFHNWIQFYLQEKIGSLNYFGYVRTKEPNLYDLHFEWHNALKGLAGIVIGPSPLYELAVYTLCHVTRPDSVCAVLLRDADGVPVKREIQTYTWKNKIPRFNLRYVGTAFFILQ
ncbi:unnamed protein product [Clavelina lepadiformis]|uniref:Uridylate-specific endoribonuclease n=1 Tax=Clavelina lepadiformis TaxID=159417 RepID=A0ABP0F4I1_CLALP